MAQLFSNVARAQLSAGIIAGDTTISISSGGNLFPIANTGTAAISLATDWFKATLQDATGIEVVYVRTHTSGANTFSNVLRGQEGTTARSFAVGSVFGLRATAQDMVDRAVGPAAATANNIPTFNGSSGKVLQDSGKALPTGTVVGTTDTQTLTNKTLTGVFETRVTMPANNIDLSTGNYFSKTIIATTTFTVSNVPTTGTATSFILDLTNGGSFAVTWWSNVKWASGLAPTLTATGRDVLGFFTHDAGATWTGLLVGSDVK